MKLTCFAMCSKIYVAYVHSRYFLFKCDLRLVLKITLLKSAAVREVCPWSHLTLIFKSEIPGKLLFSVRNC